MTHAEWVEVEKEVGGWWSMTIKEMFADWTIEQGQLETKIKRITRLSNKYARSYATAQSNFLEAKEYIETL